MKKIYLQPQMELTECVMLRAAVCSGGVSTGGNETPSTPTPAGPPTTPAPGRVF